MIVDAHAWVPDQAATRAALTVRLRPQGDRYLFNNNQQPVEAWVTDPRRPGLLGVPRMAGFKWMNGSPPVYQLAVGGVVDIGTQAIVPRNVAQARAIADLTEAFEGRGLMGAILEGRTGTGKTTVGLQVAQNLHLRTLVLV